MAPRNSDRLRRDLLDLHRLVGPRRVAPRAHRDHCVCCGLKTGPHPTEGHELPKVNWWIPLAFVYVSVHALRSRAGNVPWRGGPGAGPHLRPLTRGPSGSRRLPCSGEAVAPVALFIDPVPLRYLRQGPPVYVPVMGETRPEPRPTPLGTRSARSARPVTRETRRR